LTSIDKSRHVPLSRFILALNIKFVGEGTAEILAEEIGDLTAIASMSAEELQKIPGIGQKIAESLVEYFSDQTHLQEIYELIKAGVEISSAKIKRIQGHLFEGKLLF